MKRKFFIYLFSFFLIILIITIIFLFNGFVIGDVGENYDAEKVIGNLYDAIESAEQKGDYKCCIKPACTMCYLGHWKFDKGNCYCDEAIAEGRFGDVCPECKSGIEKGFCSSTVEKGCELDEEIYGK